MIQTRGDDRRRCNRRRWALRLAAVSLCAVGSGCGGGKVEREPIVVIGMDGLDWQIIDPLMAAGRMPNFQRLVGESVRGDLLTVVPLAQSPAIWTTIATGKFPEEHGVSGFLQRNKEGRPVTSGERRVKALWNILGSAGYRVGIVGWLVTWPCEAVNGFMVSDYVQYNFDELPLFEGQTFPADLFERIEPDVLRRDTVTNETMARFLDLRPGDLQDEGIERGVEALRWIYAADESFARVGLDLLRSERPDLFAVYFRGPDACCHTFWGYRSTEEEPSDHPFAPIIDRYYEYMDEVLGRFLDQIGEETSLLLVSDHGYQGATVLADGTVIHGTGSHREYGVIIARGPRFRRGGEMRGAAVEDITPTLLHLAGLPQAKDMDGEVLWDLFSPGEREAHPDHFIETYETGTEAARPSVKESPVDETLKERLRSLGYL